MGIGEDSNKLTEDIVASYGARAQVIGTMIKETRALAKNTQTLLKGFSSEHKDRAASLKASLEKNTADIQTSVKNKLQEFSAAHAQRSDELKKDLAKYVADIFNGTQELLAGFHDEREKMGAHWQAMAVTRGQKRGIKPGEAEAAAGMKTDKKPHKGKRGRTSAHRG
jgi:ElaB/YqjD/DUF883 family membrane-anchored ribosome-binding protein